MDRISGIATLGLGIALAQIAAPACAQDYGPTVFGGTAEPIVPATVVETRTHTGDVTAPVDTTDPVSLSLTYVADAWGLASGGIRRDARYLDNLDIQLNVDLDAVAHIPDTTLFVYGLYNNGKAFSGDLVGDAMAVSNIETGVRALRLYEAWVQHDMADGRVSLRAGLYDFNSEFDSLDSAALFLNGAHGIGADISQSGENGPSIFPFTSLAARLEVGISDNWRVRMAVLDGVPGDPARPKRTAIHLGNGDGALIAGEIQYANDNSKVLAGYWRYTGAFEDLEASAQAGVPVRGKGNEGFYLRGEHWLHRVAGSDSRGLAGFARIGVASGRFNTFRSFYSVGATYTGLFASRPDDQIGLALAWAQTGSRARRAAALSGSPLDGHEANLELTWRAPLTDWLTVQPDIQYVVNPGLDPTLKNALAFGLRVELGWSF